MHHFTTGIASPTIDAVYSRMEVFVGRMRGLPTVIQACLSYRRGGGAPARKNGAATLAGKARGGDSITGEHFMSESGFAENVRHGLVFSNESDLDDAAAMLRGYGRLPTREQTHSIMVQLAAEELVFASYSECAPRSPMVRLAYGADDVRIALRNDPLVNVVMKD